MKGAENLALYGDILLVAVLALLAFIRADLREYSKQERRVVIEHVYKYELSSKPVERTDTIIVYRDTTIRNEWTSNIPSED